MSKIAYRPYIQPLIQEQQNRGVRSILGLLGIVNKPLRTVLTKRMGGTPGTQGSLLADPVFEPTFGWTECDETIDTLKGKLLNRRLVTALSKPPAKLADEYAFPLDRHPFTHQLKSWEILSQPEPKSLVVTSGTGSGKTECFMVPILNRLANQVESEGSLVGVRALFIYPLNALISSQQNRLDAWTHEFNGDIRYCLYTGQLEQKEKSNAQEYKGQVIDRDRLRKSAPPMLITNATMLEYMLVRKEDSPILEKSKGKLEWIVLDEAHTYVGSQAAEMALLLRRAMIAFGVDPCNVRFIATSATFGQDLETTQKLQRFLADMAGVDTSQVEVVYGHRKVPSLPKTNQVNKLSCDDIRQIDSDSEASELRFNALTENETAVELRNAFLINQEECRPQSLSELTARFKKIGLDSKNLLTWLDVLSGTRSQIGVPFLPLRIHLFHNVLSSVGACANCSCPERSKELVEQENWAFGALYTDGSTKCKCGSPVLPLIQCTDCAEPYLKAYISSNTAELTAPMAEDEDEFSLNLDHPEEASDEELSPVDQKNEILICNAKHSESVDEVWLSLPSRKLSDRQTSADDGKIFYFTESEDVACPCCLGRSHIRPFRRLAVGAPFTLSTVISSLLEFCPEDKDNPSDKPFLGKKMISFTDSRQGTARAAVKIQQDSERGKVRSFIYHSLVNIQNTSALTDEDKDDLTYLEIERKERELSPPEKRSYERILAKLGSGLSKTMSWSDMVQKLSMDSSIQNAMLDYYRQQSPVLFSSNSGPLTLSKLFLFREFARRPKHQNSLESMGLVRIVYPQLDQIKTTPADWPNKNLPSWKNYLKVLLDFYVRENSFVEIPPEYLPLMGAKIHPKQFIAPSSEDDNTTRRKKWPQAEEGKSRYARPISLLLAAFSWTLDLSNIHAVNRILSDAWTELNVSKIFTQSADGFRLNLNEVHFQLIEEASLCPVTRRFLDTDFFKFSPYLGNNHAKAKISETFKIPVYPIAFNGIKDRAEALLDARNWLETNVEVISLREQGLWSDLNDRIVEGANFFRTAEHSAQQNQKRLKGYEKLFKEGRVNLLSCSTTMEMGVDIGGITIVGMNNVPPHPANYLQRAGRAGRRSETRSVAMTVCKQTPHDQAVFKDPMWPFKTKISVPEVSLRSHDLLQRHINALLLSTWLKTYVQTDELLKLTCGTFFAVNGQYSFADRFSIWCSSFAKDIEKYPDVKSNLVLLLKNTTLTVNHLRMLIETTRQQMIEAQGDWRKSQEAILSQIAAVFSGTSDPAFKALSIQQKRLEEEYLLSELAEKRFLPGYGFPTGIVSFDNLSVSNYKSPDTDGREDNRGKFRQLPSRDRATGLREYAPGAELVIDGLVYKSSGITLNWHAPASEKDLREAQLFKFAWHCKECGAAGSAIGSRPETCECCGKHLLAERIKEYLVPSGFAVDFYSDPHNDVSAPTYVPVQQPWLSLSSDWMPLANPSSGQFRCSQKAHLFYHTSGADQNGFAICLDCGRAEPMLGNADPNANLNEELLPSVFRKNNTHTRLRGGKNEKGENQCPGSDSAWKIKQNVHLGHDTITDAIEIMLRDPLSGNALHNDVIAYSLAVAIRSTLANIIGIQEEEFGCAAREQRVNGEIVSVIQIFDAKSGGYCTQANDLLQQQSFWKLVRSELECKEDCAAACQHCLLSYDTRFSFSRLNRHDALSFLTEEWLNAYSLPAHFRAFGDSSSHEILGVIEGIQDAISSSATSLLRLYLHGKPTEWDIPSATKLSDTLLNCISRGINVEMVSPEGMVLQLFESDRFKLASFMDLGVRLFEIPLDQIKIKDSGMHLFAQCQIGDKFKAWATNNSEFAIPNESWGNSNSATMYVKGDIDSISALTSVSITDVRPKSGDTELEITHDIDGSINGFGKRLWSKLLECSPSLAQKLLQENDPLIRIEYSDRYLRNPLAIALLVESINELKSYPAGDQTNLKVHVYTVINTKTDSRPSVQCWDDWQNTADRDQVLKDVLSYCGLDPIVSVENAGAFSKVMHGRALTLHFTSGQSIRIRLDQGFSYWRISSRPSIPYPFNVPVNEQIEKIANLPGHVASTGAAPTQLFIKIT